MATRQEPLTNTPTMGGSLKRSALSERRSSRRCKITQLMFIRPSDPEKKYFEDLRGTVSASRSGIYFHTTELGYEVGERLFVTMPYSTNPCTVSREYLVEVVRKDALQNGMIGIGFVTLSEITEQPGYSFDAPGQQN
jgi:PilZ domain